MKKSLIAAAIAAAALSASAAPPPSKPATSTELPPEIDIALRYLGTEMDARLNPGKNSRVRLEQPSKLPRSEEQKAALRAVFGTDQVPDIKRLPGAGPRTNYAFTLPAHHYPITGGQAAWSEVSTQIALDANARNMTGSGTWSTFVITGTLGKAMLTGMAFKAAQTRDVSGLWLGSTSATISHMHFAPPGASAGLTIEDTVFKVAVTRQGKTLQQQHDMLSKRVFAAGEQIDNLHLAYRVRNLDVDAMVKLKADAMKQQQTDTPQSGHTAASLKHMQAFFRTIAMRGATLELDDFSASYKGNTAQLKGSVSVPSAKADDVSTLESFFKKLAVRLEVRVPLALLRDVTQAIARKAPAPSGKDAPAPAAVEHMGQTMYDAAVGKLMANGYAKIEKEELRSTVEVRNGDIRINGKLLPPMQKPVPAPASAPAPVPAPAPAAQPAQ